MFLHFAAENSGRDFLVAKYCPAGRYCAFLLPLPSASSTPSSSSYSNHTFWSIPSQLHGLCYRMWCDSVYWWSPNWRSGWRKALRSCVNGAMPQGVLPGFPCIHDCPECFIVLILGEELWHARMVTTTHDSPKHRIQPVGCGMERPVCLPLPVLICWKGWINRMLCFLFITSYLMVGSSSQGWWGPNPIQISSANAVAIHEGKICPYLEEAYLIAPPSQRMQEVSQCHSYISTEKLNRMGALEIFA